QSVLSPLFSLLITPPPTSTLFPYTTLFRSCFYRVNAESPPLPPKKSTRSPQDFASAGQDEIHQAALLSRARMTTIMVTLVSPMQDRKSTRLNSSHRTISYAVFCLKKKKKKK